MTILVAIRSSLRPWLLLYLWFIWVAVPGLSGPSTPGPVELQARVAPQPIRLPIVDATDNRFLRLSTAEGMSQLKADHIVQDDSGFMWFGTHFGLYRYDGYTFKTFVRDPAKPGSLDGIDVRALFKDREGVLWIGCDQSLDRFDRATETFKRFPIPLATHIAQDTAGLLWVTTLNGMYRLDPASGAIEHYSHDPNDPTSISSNDLSYCGEDKAGSLWVASNRGLDEFDRRAGKITRHIVLPDVQGSQPVEGLELGFYEDHLGQFWIFHGSPNPLTLFDRKTNTLTHYAFPDHKPTVTRVHAMMEDRNGTLWIATHGLGLLKLVREQSKFIRYVNVPSDPESLPQDKLDALFADREGNIWAAFGRLAPAFLAPEPAPFEKLPKVPGTTIEPFIGALYEDHEGVLWTGTPEALIRRDQKTGRITAYRTGGPAVYTDVVSICEDHSGNLWLGTYGHGLHRFDRRTGTFSTYRYNSADPHSLSNDIVMRCLVDHHGTLWAGTADGLDRFDAATGGFTTYKLEPQSILILELIEDRQGMIWVGTDASGLRRFDRATGQIAVYQHSTNVPSTLSDNRVNSVHFDHSGTMWVGTQNGLDRLDPQTGKFSAFTPRDGLPGNAVGCILEDKDGNLWMSTNNGVARFSSQSKSFTRFSTAEGLPGPNLTGWGACFQSPSGKIFFGGYNGGTSFFPDRVADSSHAPPVVLTDFRLFGNPVQIGADSPLRRSISYSGELTLGSHQNIFSIGFAGLSYASPATNRYRYKLEGLEHNWNEVGSDRRQATYTTLPPGTYTFRAQAATSRGPWTDPGVALRIEILPPWWSTSRFQALYISAFLVCIWSLYRYRIGQLKHRYQLRLEERVNERTRLARELHDTLLQSFHGLMLHFQVVNKLLPEGKAKEQLEKAMQRADGAIAEGRSAVYDLRSSTTATSDLAEAVNAVGNELSNDNDAAFNLMAEGPTRDLHPIIRDEIYRISREALSNAFKHAHARHIEAEISYGPRAFRLRIRDDGEGIPAEVLEQGRAGHFGLPGIRERAKQIGAELTIWSRPGTGTEIDLSLAGTIAYGTSPRRSRFGLFKQKADEK